MELEILPYIWLRSTDPVSYYDPSPFPSFTPRLIGSNSFFSLVEVLDHLLDQEGLEVDPINRMEQETPLHKAVQYANKEKEHGVDVVEMLIDAGADPRFVACHTVPLHSVPHLFLTSLGGRRGERVTVPDLRLTMVG